MTYYLPQNGTDVQRWRANKYTLMLHKRECGHAEKAHKVGIFIDRIHVAEGLNPMLCSENG
jgi:hypothetical protein